MNAHNYVIFHLSEKLSRYSERVRKNALEKCIFCDLFSLPIKRKEPYNKLDY